MASQNPLHRAEPKPPEEATSEPAGAADRLATFEQYRKLLFSVAYRMLGSVADAEDMLQETFIRWEQAAEAEIRSPRAYLVTIISRLCINQMESARAKREKYVGQWLPEPLVTDARSDPQQVLKVDESLSMAFLLLLERLSPMERAVFLLREVFGYKYGEIAETLGQSEANCRQILKRARQNVGAVRQRFQPTAEEQRQLLERFFEATQTGDMEGLVALLANDVVLHADGGGRAIAVPNVVRGIEHVARALVNGRKRIPENLVPRVAEINGEPGFVGYVNGKPQSVLTFSIEGGRIHAIYIVTNPEKLSHLPDLSAAPC